LPGWAHGVHLVQSRESGSFAKNRISAIRPRKTSSGACQACITTQAAHLLAYRLPDQRQTFIRVEKTAVAQPDMA